MPQSLLFSKSIPFMVLRIVDDVTILLRKHPVVSRENVGYLTGCSFAAMAFGYLLWLNKLILHRIYTTGDFPVFCIGYEATIKKLFGDIAINADLKEFIEGAVT